MNDSGTNLIISQYMLFQTEIPLSERLRPQLIDEFIGQAHLIGKGGPIRNIIESGAMPSKTGEYVLQS